MQTLDRKDTNTVKSSTGLPPTPSLQYKWFSLHTPNTIKKFYLWKKLMYKLWGLEKLDEEKRDELFKERLDGMLQTAKEQIEEEKKQMRERKAKQLARYQTIIKLTKWVVPILVGLVVIALLSVASYGCYHLFWFIHGIWNTEWMVSQIPLILVLFGIAIVTTVTAAVLITLFKKLPNCAPAFGWMAKPFKVLAIPFVKIGNWIVGMVEFFVYFFNCLP